ncbi:MAG: alpha/beta hydrolase [Solirubrobacterales bacterium]
MKSLPRLPIAAERRIVKRAMSLPPRLQHRIFGPPAEVEGQRLASDQHVLLRLAELVGATSFAATTVEQARALARREAAVAAARPPVALDRVEAIEVPGAAGPLPARLYVPFGPPAAEPPPLLVYFHGGGWVIGDLDTHDDLCRLLAARSGVRVLSVEYRLAPEHPFPAPVDDAHVAFDWAAAEAATLGADPARVAIGGDSAGGNLAAVVSMLVRDAGGRPPALQLLIYPATDAHARTRSRQLFGQGYLLTREDTDFFEGHYLPREDDRGDPRASVLRASDLSGLPPAYVVTAGFDPLRDEGEEYALRMRAAGVPVALRRHPGLAHSFANQTAISRTARAAMLELAGALRMGLARTR